MMNAEKVLFNKDLQRSGTRALLIKRVSVPFWERLEAGTKVTYTYNLSDQLHSCGGYRRLDWSCWSMLSALFFV